MKVKAWIVVVVTLTFGMESPLFAADTLLRLAQRTSIARGSNATNAQRDLEQKVHEAEDRAKQKAAELSQHTADLEQDARNALAQDLIDGRAALIQELKCSLNNVKNSTHISTTVEVNRSDSGVQHAVIKLADLFTGDTSRETLGVRFQSFAEDGKTPRFDLIDVSSGNVIKSGKFEDLGIQDVTSSCELSKRVVSLRDGVVQVDAQHLEKETISNTENLVKDTVQKAKEAN